MTERVRAPDDLGDLRQMLLPSRACLLSVRDVLCPARRSGLHDAVAAARDLPLRGGDDDYAGAAALAALWEAVACLELAATVAAPWVDPQINAPNGAWTEMTRYDPGRATRFYESSHKWTDERYAVLSSHRFRHGDDVSMLALMKEQGMIDERLLTAFSEAEQATAHFLRRQFEELARMWKQMRAFAAAYEHGMLLVPSEIGEVVDESDKVIPHAILIFETRNDASRGQIGDSAGEAVDAGEYTGELAVDVAEYVADARLRTVETLEFDGDDVYLRVWEEPFPYWFDKADVSEETLDLLGRGVRIGWIPADDDVGERLSGKREQGDP